MARRKRPGPLDIVLLGDESTGRGGSRTLGRSQRVSRRTGRSRQTGWGAEFRVRDPYSVTIDARDLATITGDKVLPYLKNTLRANLDHRGQAHPEDAEKRVLMGRRGIMDKDEESSQWQRGQSYLVDALRRTWQGKNYPKGGRWTNQRRTKLKFYFGPNMRGGRGGFPNPAAAWNKLQDKMDMPNLGVDGPVDALIGDALDEWTQKVLDGRNFKRDTKADALNG